MRTTNGKRRNHICLNPGFFEQPKWKEISPGRYQGSEICGRCSRAAFRLYGYEAYSNLGLHKLPIWKSASTEIIRLDTGIDNVID